MAARLAAPDPRSSLQRKGIDLTQVKLYDTTLRDGMQGQGMSLSAAEKVRVVQALDGLGVQLIEAGFVGSNPKDAELFLADEVFLTGTAAELVPVREVDDHAIGEPGEVTRVIQAKFEDALHGRAPEYREWLDAVEQPSRVTS